MNKVKVILGLVDEKGGGVSIFEVRDSLTQKISGG
jgi:hypothetical protein